MAKQVSLSGKKVVGRFIKREASDLDVGSWIYDGNQKMATEKKEYPPAVFMRISKAGTSLYGFTPDEGITGGKTLVMNRADLLKLLKKEVEFVKVGILEPSGKKETNDTDGLEG